MAWGWLRAAGLSRSVVGSVFFFHASRLSKLTDVLVVLRDGCIIEHEKDLTSFHGEHRDA